MPSRSASRRMVRAGAPSCSSSWRATWTIWRARGVSGSATPQARTAALAKEPAPGQAAEVRSRRLGVGVDGGVSQGGS
jgi:hypothetical protein